MKAVFALGKWAAVAIAAWSVMAHATEPSNRYFTQSAGTASIAHALPMRESNLSAPGVEVDRSLSKRWLRGEGTRNQSKLVIGRSDPDAIMLGYQDRSGKRLIFRAANLPKGVVLSEVLHFNPQTGRAERLIDFSKDIDPATGKRVRDFKVNGTNLFSQLKSKRDKKSGTDTGRQKVAQFADSDAGEAFLRGVAALYVVLDESEFSAQQEKLKLHFGVLAMMVQFAGERSKGLPDVERFAANEKQLRLRDGCAAGDCEVRGKSFVIHKSGFLDVMSKPMKPKNQSLGQPRSNLLSKLTGGNGPAPESSQHLSNTVQQCYDQVNNQSMCFGRCGYQCGDINIVLTQCFAHDWCVCRFGTLACAGTTPSECAGEPEGCGGFLEAVIAVGEYLFVETFNLIENAIESIVDFISDVMQVTVELVSDFIDGIVDLVSDLLDWIFNDSDCMEESEVAC